MPPGPQTVTYRAGRPIDRKCACDQIPFETPDDARLWRDAQQEFVKGAPNRGLVTAAKSSHDITHGRPDVIVTAVGQMLKAAGRP
ncbi:hypothetical protein ACIQM0_23015 [Streptomyces sp. NPDC091387]|uniref:hypothetical protein n=1 Tax=Streptomyces sp. NPDC091387 TaxID=3365998 RepID=UPI0038051C9D